MKKFLILFSLLLLSGCGGKGGGGSDPPVTQLSAAALAFASPGCGSDPASQTFEISNAGGGSLAWSISNLPAWLAIAPTSGTAPAAVTVQATTAGLACGGSYSQQISIGAAGAAPVSMAVTLTIPDAAPSSPQIGINPGSHKLTFTAQTCGGLATTAAPSFEIVNTGSGRFNWSGRSNASWLQFSPLSGADGATVTARNIDTMDLPCGQTTSGIITIASVEAQNAPQSVTIDVVVPSAAGIHPNTTALGFFATACKATPDPLQFTIKNDGGSPLQWNAAVTYTGPATGWAALDIANGSLAVANAQPVTVTVNASSLACGRGHSAIITLTGTGGGNNISPVQSKVIKIGLSSPIAWEHQNPQPTGDHLRGVAFSEPGVAWTVGDAGTILRSADNGNSWSPVASGGSTNLTAIAFADSLEGWIVGEFGLILHTTDGGATWNTETNPVTQHLRSISVVDKTHVWAVGDNKTIIFRDSTAAWANKSMSGNHMFSHIFMNDPAHGWIASNNNNLSPAVPALLWTSDNWDTFQTVPLPSGVAALSSIFFLPLAPGSGVNGWIVGDADTGTGHGTILSIQSNDLSSPGSVTKQESGVAADLSDVYFFDANNGWAVGNNGTILATSNGASPAAVWTAQAYTNPPAQRLQGLAFKNGAGVAVGFTGSVVSKGAGASVWVTISGGSSAQLNAVSFASEIVTDPVTNVPRTNWYGWAAGANNTVLNIDLTGGGSWNTTQVSGNFVGLSAITKNDVWAVTSGRQIYHYTGAWPNSPSFTLSGSGILTGIHFPDANHGWAVGRITDLSNNKNEVYFYNGAWNPQGFCSITTTMNAVHFVDSNTGWVAGTGGIIASTTNGGGSWSCQVVGSSAMVWNALFFVDAFNGWAVSNTGKIYHYHSDGITSSWTSQTSFTSDPLYGVHFIDSTHGWIAGGTGGARGFVLVTTDGLTWTKQLSGTNQALKRVFFKDINEGWAVGLNGTILHTQRGGNN